MTNSSVQPTNPANWFKSSYSEGSGNACVEVAIQAAEVLVRDSKDLTTPHFRVSTAAWSTFVDHAAR
ncbi:MULTISPECIES: DUF397 domain-containing protein [Streptomyces]|uniref:DUF397 domain-containing protein n=1 Tax=Streptomyces TaxID=1883 RepID=UPI00099B8CD1|nr:MULTISPECIES: DUF397 domain-containing protein [Streptomyces]RZF06992.1 DUF397 domain-containing protein [Streptomyces albidoflavus]